MLAEPPPLTTPTIDGKYRLEELIGEGAYGTVYRAVHLDLKKSFALKLLHPAVAGDPQLLGRFRREAEALGRLHHPGIVGVTDFGLDPKSGSPYLVMELLEGLPLSELLRAEGALPLERALPILAAIAGAIDAAHALGVLHRDLKPGNVLLGGPDGPIAKVLDFGLAELGVGGFGGAGFDSAQPAGFAPSGVEGFAADSRLTATGALLGTPLYIAPELIDGGRASRASDLYSFGVIAYEILAGFPPFRGSTGEVLAAHRKLAPPAPPTLGGTLPAEAWEALRAPLSKDPAARPDSAGAVVEQLAAAGRRAGRRSWRAREVPRRLGLAALFALPLAAAGAFSHDPVWAPLEARAFDARLRLARPEAPDPRILLVTLEGPSPGSPPQPLASRGAEIARAGEAILAAGARGLALDILPPAWWSQSQPIQDLLLGHAERLTLVAASVSTGVAETVEGSDFVHPLTTEQLGRAAATSMFGFINVAADTGGVIRKGRTSFRTTRGARFPSWAARAAGSLAAAPPDLGASFWIDYRIDAARYASLPLERVEAEAARHPERFRDRLVLLGGDLGTPIEDREPVPRLRDGAKSVPGLVLQALQVDTLLRAGSPRSLREVSARPFAFIAAAAAFLLAASVLLLRRPFWAVAAGIGASLAATALSFALFRSWGLLLPWTPTAAFLLLGALAPWGALRFLAKVPST
jgi:CHASE2 domain-containing sensor protein